MKNYSKLKFWCCCIIILVSCIQKPDKQDTGRRVKLELTQIDKFSEPLKKFLKSMSSTEIEQFPIEYRKHLLNF